MAKWTKIGAVMAGKPENGGGFYIKLTKESEGITLRENETLSLKDPRASLDEAVKAGRMDQEKADYLKSKIKDFIKFEVFHVAK